MKYVLVAWKKSLKDKWVTNLTTTLDVYGGVLGRKGIRRLFRESLITLSV